MNFKINERSFYWIVIAVLVVIILLLRSCGPGTGGTNEPDTVRVVDTTYIDVIKEVPVYKPGPVIYIPGDPVPGTPVDTAAILKDYFAKVVYKDTIRLDSLGFIYVKDTISQNRIQSRKLAFDYKIPIIKETTTITIPPKPKLQVYGGIEMMVGAPTGLTYFGPALTLKSKKDQMYSIGAGINPTGGIQYKFGTSWKIRLKK